MSWVTDSHAISIGFGVLSSGFWIGSVFVKSKIKPHRVVITMDNETNNVDLHNLILSLQLQSKYNGYAAICAAIAILAQIGGV